MDRLWDYDVESVERWFYLFSYRNTSQELWFYIEIDRTYLKLINSRWQYQLPLGIIISSGVAVERIAAGGYGGEKRGRLVD